MFEKYLFSKFMSRATRAFLGSTNHRIVMPGVVTPPLDVPTHIKRPDYRNLKKKFLPKIKSDDEIKKTWKSCQLARDALKVAAEIIKPGITTEYIDEVVHNKIISQGAYPSPLGYRGFPKSCCTSVNNVACHGIPDSTILMDGDVINVDVSVYYDGYHGDTSDTFAVGKVDEAGVKLIEVAKECLDLAIQGCSPGTTFSSIGDHIEGFVEKFGFTVCRDYVGHGIGEDFHEAPDIRHYRNNHTPLTMGVGMVFTIEPIIMEGGCGVWKHGDGWTVLAVDNKRSAQCEHTLLITNDGCEVLTM
ncbi:methionine aminopeptidase 1D, mitochondrial-like [Ciona intestinalis]